MYSKDQVTIQIRLIYIVGDWTLERKNGVELLNSKRAFNSFDAFVWSPNPCTGTVTLLPTGISQFKQWIRSGPVWSSNALTRLEFKSMGAFGAFFMFSDKLSGKTGKGFEK